jgi:hypothetical protein
VEYANLHITHFYGTIGTLATAHGKGRKYGPMGATELAHAAASISTCYESGADAAAAARKLITESEEVVFLGLGYSKENLARLEFGKSLQPTARVRGSTHLCPAYARTLQDHIDIGRFGAHSGALPSPATTALLAMFPG